MTFEEWMESQQEGVAACDHITFGRKVWAACVASRDAEVESLRQQLAAAKEEITLDEQRVADLMSQVGELSEQISKRDAEVESLRQQLADEQSACQLGHNLFAMQLLRADRLQEHLADTQKREVMLRDALETTHELYANASSGYGFARPENPHNFHCDIDCCSKEEIAAHSKACDDFAAGRKVSNDSWGIGTYCDEYMPAIEALAATEQRSTKL